MWEKISRFYPPWLDAAALICLGFVWFYTASRFGLMPERIPTHFGPGGAPDAWSVKSFGSVFMLLMIGTVVWLSMFLVNYYLIIKPEDPRKYINIPGARKAAMNSEQIEAIRKATVQGMVMINMTMVLMFAVIQYGMVNTALGIQKGLGWGVYLLVGILILESVWLTWKTFSLSKPDRSNR
jgi:uncharacterized membrane protein